MGLFGSNYERAGSGIAKNAPKKKGFFRFFEIFGRKFWKLFELNFLYFLSFLPVIGAAVLYLVLSSQLGTILAAACLVLFAVIIGPATAAHTKILKNFVMEKPTFLAHDFFRTFRSEFKHSCIVGILDCLLIVSAVVAVYAVVLMFVNIRYSMILLFLLPFLPASWLGLVIVFQSYPIIQKYIINPYYEQRGEVNPELAQASASEEETVFEDMGGKEKPIEPPKKAGGKSSGSRAHKGKGKIIS